MLETPHTVVGAAIAFKIPNPYIAIPLSFASHFVLEKVPHWNPHLYTETKKHGKVTRQSTAMVVLDVILSLTIGIAIASNVLPNTNHAMTILFSSFAAVLPDVVEGPYFFLGLKNNLIKKWIKWQRSIQTDAKPFWGLTTQIITIVVALWWIFTP